VELKMMFKLESLNSLKNVFISFCFIKNQINKNLLKFIFKMLQKRS